MGILMIKCPSTGHAISTGIEMDQSRFGSSAVFFRRTFCPICRSYHEWFARDAWVCEERRNGTSSPARTGSNSLWNGTDARGSEGRVFKSLKGVPMDKTIARLNIEHFRKKLATEQDERKRLTILRLLVEEEAKLAALNDPPEAEKA